MGAGGTSPHNQRRLAEHRGSTAGRVPYLAELGGPGVPALRSRLRAQDEAISS